MILLSLSSPISYTEAHMNPEKAGPNLGRTVVNPSHS
jgi:hypothetical protein